MRLRGSDTDYSRTKRLGSARRRTCSGSTRFASCWYRRPSPPHPLRMGLGELFYPFGELIESMVDCLEFVVNRFHDPVVGSGSGLLWAM